MMAKRIFDVISSLIGLVILFPMLILVGIMIKIESTGPIFYRGTRIGLHGKPFRIYKFRSMLVNAERIGSTATAHNDPRVTKIGAFIRKYKIDELPQLVNVLKGEMSLVGPRPEVEEHTAVYNDEEKIILTVVPGITDYSSIRFRNLNELLGNENANQVFIEKYRDEKNKLRIEYVKKRSFVEDLKIILKTINVVLFDR